MKKLNIILSVAAMLILSAAAFAGRPQDAQSPQQPSAQSGTGHGHGAGEGRGMGMNADTMLDRMSKELNLTDDQKAKIKPILEEQTKQMQDLRQNTSASDQDRRAKMKQIHENTMSQVRPILTADQQKKLDEMMSRRGEHGEAHQHGPDSSSPQ